MKIKKPNFFKSPLEFYRENLEGLMQDQAQIFREKSVKKKLPLVYTLVFPKTDSRALTTFSYGLSFAEHPDQYNRIELCLQINSTDLAWAHIVGFLTNHLRGDCPFNTGEIIRLGQRISSESDLNAFVVVASDIFTAADQIRDSRKSNSVVQLVRLLPIFEQETLTIQKIGLSRFLHKLGDQKLNPHRSQIE